MSRGNRNRLDRLFLGGPAWKVARSRVLLAFSRRLPRLVTVSRPMGRHGGDGLDNSTSPPYLSPSTPPRIARRFVSSPSVRRISRALSGIPAAFQSRFEAVQKQLSRWRGDLSERSIRLVEIRISIFEIILSLFFSLSLFLSFVALVSVTQNGRS